VKKELKMTEVFTSWEEMTVLEQMQCQYWDMYKDAYGIRPRHVDTTKWTEEMFTEEFESLAKTIQREEEQRKESQEIASHDFEMRMLSLLQMGAKDREMAMRWVHEAEGSGGDNEYLCFLLGLPYRYFA